ncbi:hypothetical protein LTR13_002428 [Exophiala sideris]|uniref:C2H2-type domain-containing protein n=1 Tax=Exophiala sideris TaxID=1016849 RepID=A0ABR0JLE3_9EURO|nr:hypothetical protein LTR13_002428 [Exophiala sideris]KAK5066791.1 hypothetical protein LTR69_002138 [Exophiala sideris]
MDPILEQLRKSQRRTTPRAVVLVVSTNDGLFTNPAGFITFFAEFAESDITYVVHDIHGRSPRVFNMQDIIQAVREAGTGVTKHNAVHILLKEMLVIAVGKLLISNGMLIHRSQTFGRNSADFTSLDEFELDTETTDFTFHDASSRYYRAFQRFGQDGIPVLEFREDKRVHISKLLDSLVCPVKECYETFPTRVELTAHLVGHTTSEEFMLSHAAGIPLQFLQIPPDWINYQEDDESMIVPEDEKEHRRTTFMREPGHHPDVFVRRPYNQAKNTEVGYHRFPTPDMVFLDRDQPGIRGF